MSIKNGEFSGVFRLILSCEEQMVFSTFWSKLASRNLEIQQVEALLKYHVLNKLTQLGLHVIDIDNLECKRQG